MNRHRSSMVLASAIVAGLLVGTGVGVEAQPRQTDPRVAPVTTTSADGRTTTDGVRTLTASQAFDLEPSGQTVAVAGSGYDAAKGIYVALCAIPPRNSLPSPCGGGVDIEGQAGAAQWISSNPPDYGVGLAQPYGPSGSFSTRFNVRAEIAPGVDCRQVRCAIVTRSDHTRTSDRSQDIFIPVSFRAEPTPSAPTTTPPSGGGGQSPDPTATPQTTAPAVEVPVTAAPEAPKSAAPDATVSDDGTEVSDGGRTLRSSAVTDLDPDGAAVTLTGSGFEEGAGIYVALCAASDDPTVSPGPCSAGGGASAWISSNPPEAGAELAEPFDEGGSFEVDLEVGAVIDAETDCREVACALAVRYDDQRRDDRTGDLSLPVTFAASSTPDTTTTTAVAADEADGSDEATVSIADEPEGGGGRSGAPFAVGGGLVAAALVGGGLVRRSRRGPAEAAS